MVKEPVTLFEKSKGTQAPIWLVPSSVWVSEVWSKHGLKWLQECAFTCWRPISPLCFLLISATGCKWGKKAPFIYLSVYLRRDSLDNFFTDSLWVFHFEVFFTHVAISCFLHTWALSYIFKEATPKKRHLIKQFLVPNFIRI